MTAGARHPFRIGVPAAASLLVNAMLAAMLMSLGIGHLKEKPRPPARTVVSLAAVKGAEQGEEATDAAEQSKPAPSVQTAAATPPPAMIPPLVPPTIQRPVINVATPAVAPPTLPLLQPASAAPAASAASAARQLAASPPAAQVRKGTADGLEVKAPSGNSRGYAARVRSWLYAHKIYPRRAKMRHEEGVVRIRFTIDRAGLLLDGGIVQGSGNGAFDDEAMSMLRRASPFPKAPADIAGERIEFIVPIEFMLDA